MNCYLGEDMTIWYSVYYITYCLYNIHTDIPTSLRSGSTDMNLFIYSSFTQCCYLLFVWYVPGTILGAQHTTVNRIALSDLEELVSIVAGSQERKISRRLEDKKC